MNDNRDLYLRYLGIGELWQLRAPSLEQGATQGMTQVPTPCTALFVLGDIPDKDFDTTEVDKLFANILTALSLADEQQHQATCPATWPAMHTDGDDGAAQWRSRVQQAVTAASPKAILVFGQRAAQVLLDMDADTSFEALRRSAHSFQGIPLIVTHTPKFLLEHPEQKRETWIDLCKVKELLS